MASRLRPRCAGPGLPVGELWLRVLVSCANTRGVATLCVALRDQQSKCFGGFRVGLACVSGWRRVQFTLESIPRFTSATRPYSVLLAHDQCSVTLREGTREAKHDAPQERCARERVHCAADCRLQRECRCTSPSIRPSPTCGRREARTCGRREARSKRAEGGARDRRVNRRGGRQAAPLSADIARHSSL